VAQAPDVLEDLRRVGALKRSRLQGKPSDRALAAAAGIAPGTPGVWLRGERLPQQLDQVLTVMARIRAEAHACGVLDTPVDSSGETVAELLDAGRWKASFQIERDRRAQTSREAAERQQAQAALVADERRAGPAALPDRLRPVSEWTPKRLGVHAAIPGHATPTVQHGFVLPAYVPRAHDTELRDALTAAVAPGASPLLVLVSGESCTGKTRSAFEAVRAVVPAWDLLAPVTPEGVLAALAADAMAPHTVLWLNEAQDYLKGPTGEAVAAGLLRCLDGQGPLIVVATLWPVYDQELTQPADASGHDPHTYVRVLLAQAHRIHVPRDFTGSLDSVRASAGYDLSLKAALATGGAEISQTLAAASDLVAHYAHPTGTCGPAAQALISVAMDAHRLGVTSPLPLSFLEAAAPGYLTGEQRAHYDSDTWFAPALAYAQSSIKKVTAALQKCPRPSGMGHQDGVVRLADYLQQYGRTARCLLCPPASFFEAAARHLTQPAELNALAREAARRYRTRDAAPLFCQAAEAGDPFALEHVTAMREEAGNRAGAERLARIAAEVGITGPLLHLMSLRQRAGDPVGAELFAREATAAGDHHFALMQLSEMWARTGDSAGAERLAREAADAGEFDALRRLAERREDEADHLEAERLYRAAAAAGDSRALRDLAKMWERAGQQVEAERLYREAAAEGSVDALAGLASMWERTGRLAEAESLYREAAAEGSTDALRGLAKMRERTGGLAEAECLYRDAADAGDSEALGELAEMWDTAGDWDRAAHLFRESGWAPRYVLHEMNMGNADKVTRIARASAHPLALMVAARMREQAGGLAEAESLYREAADAGASGVSLALARLRERIGDHSGAERLAREAADIGVSGALVYLAGMCERTGNLDRAKRMYREAADAGDLLNLRDLASLLDEPERQQLLRYGLKADGSIAEPWPWPEPGTDHHA
jgi:hypothetical protein